MPSPSALLVERNSLKLGVIVDNGHVTRWQLAALAHLDPANLILYNCTNTRAGKKSFRYAFYYLLSFFCSRIGIRQKVPIRGARLPIQSEATFSSVYEGAWQSLPSSILERIKDDKPDLIVKFGMGLLRVPPSSDLSCPILSYHHGDPEIFRGRPAGFHEMVQNAPVMGQIVQVLSNKLDAGAVVAFSETKIHRHSYRATLAEAYSHSPLILRIAVRNALAGAFLNKLPHGRNYRLPRNGAVAAFMARLLCRTTARLFYGAFIEKAWRVSLCRAAPELVTNSPGAQLSEPSKWRSVERPNGYRFLADPFFLPCGEGLLVEGLCSKSGKGHILQIPNSGRSARLSEGAGHYSYPAWFVDDSGRRFIIPETAQWSSPTIFEIQENRFRETGRLDIPGNPHLLDPTIFAKDGRLYLFGNVATEGSNVLRLWSSDGIFQRFEEHPESPVRISPRGSRMGGQVVPCGADLVRLGQDFTDSYGNGLFLFKIDHLDHDSYKETLLSELRLEGIKGPHTLNFQNGEAVFDWYRDRFSPLAGVRRLFARLSLRGG